MDAMARTSDGEFNPQDVVMVRGGIERYMKTFPEGGFWKGKNYLFDRRREQVPEAKSEQALAADVESFCCVCQAPESTYRGSFSCAGVLPPPIGKCGVPVILCAKCARDSMLDTSSLRCPLCEEGYVPPQAKPDIVAAKRKIEIELGGDGAAVSGGAASGGAGGLTKKARREARASAAAPSTRLFIGNLPFIVTAQDVRTALQAALAKAPGAGVSAGADAIVAIRWLSDHKTNLFYGSAFVQMRSVEAAGALVDVAKTEAAAAVSAAKAPRLKQSASDKKQRREAKKAEASADAEYGSLKLGGRRLRVAFSPPQDGDDWPPKPADERERPPIGV